MSTRLGALTKASLYYVLALGLAVVVAAIYATAPEFIESLGQVDLYMLTPLTAVLLMLFVLTRDGFSAAGWKELGLNRLGLGSWALAFFAPALMLTFTYIVTWATGIGRFDASNAPTVAVVLFVFAMQLIFGAAEEIGWRGYLLPKLLPLGRTNALLLSGLMHGVWHLPVMFMASGYHSTGDRIIVVTLFLVTLTAAGVLYGYVRLAGDSLWPAVLAHATVNTTWGLLSSVTMAVSSAEMLEYWAGESGVFMVVGTVLLAVWLLYRLRQRAQRGPVESARATAR